MIPDTPDFGAVLWQTPGATLPDLTDTITDDTEAEWMLGLDVDPANGAEIRPEAVTEWTVTATPVTIPAGSDQPLPIHDAHVTISLTGEPTFDGPGGTTATYSPSGKTIDWLIPLLDQKTVFAFHLAADPTLTDMTVTVTGTTDQDLAHDPIPPLSCTVDTPCQATLHVAADETLAPAHTATPAPLPAPAAATSHHVPMATVISVLVVAAIASLLVWGRKRHRSKKTTDSRDGVIQP